MKSTSPRGNGFYVLLLVVGVLIAQGLMWPAITSASARDGGYQFGNGQALDRASVSVVRLVVGYTSVAPVAGCTRSLTGLGVLVGSWAAPPSSPVFSNWILTDGSLVDPNGISCGVGKPLEQLNSIQIYVNNAYTLNTVGLTLKSLRCRSGSCSDGATTLPITCQDSNPCNKGAVLVPFQTPVLEPFIDMAQA
ncbi:MAG: hypothetical protein M3Y76_07200, partial [Chloroflexota bacterium]|nr:hypothetical protein [Chloroflexota bacterium]